MAESQPSDSVVASVPGEPCTAGGVGATSAAAATASMASSTAPAAKPLVLASSSVLPATDAVAKLVCLPYSVELQPWADIPASAATSTPRVVFVLDGQMRPEQRGSLVQCVQQAMQRFCGTGTEFAFVAVTDVVNVAHVVAGHLAGTMQFPGKEICSDLAFIDDVHTRIVFSTPPIADTVLHELVAGFAPLSRPPHESPRAVSAAVSYAAALLRYTHVTPDDVRTAKAKRTALPSRVSPGVVALLLTGGPSCGPGAIVRDDEGERAQSEKHFRTLGERMGLHNIAVDVYCIGHTGGDFHLNELRRLAHHSGGALVCSECDPALTTNLVMALCRFCAMSVDIEMTCSPHLAIEHVLGPLAGAHADRSGQRVACRLGLAGPRTCLSLFVTPANEPPSESATLSVSVRYTPLQSPDERVSRLLSECHPEMVTVAAARRAALVRAEGGMKRSLKYIDELMRLLANPPSSPPPPWLSGMPYRCVVWLDYVARPAATEPHLSSRVSLLAHARRHPAVGPSALARDEVALQTDLLLYGSGPEAYRALVPLLLRVVPDGSISEIAAETALVVRGADQRPVLRVGEAGLILDRLHSVVTLLSAALPDEARSVVRAWCEAQVAVLIRERFPVPHLITAEEGHPDQRWLLAALLPVAAGGLTTDEPSLEELLRRVKLSSVSR